jgi:UDP-glucose 4-epimerase
MSKANSIFIVGGAGFIGSHFVDALLSDSDTERVSVYDNFSSGRQWHLEAHAKDTRLLINSGDVTNLDALTTAMRDHDIVIHLASNPDIARAMTEPDIDFWQGTVLTFNVLEAMRRSGARTILYASGSGVYGDLGTIEAFEDYGPMIPISTYGASKLAGEALISSYCHMFNITGSAFRFANVVGPRQTHGVGFDFVRQLLRNPNKLTILGDGTQSKSYVYVDDVIAAVMCAHRNRKNRFEVYNIATGDYITVSEIAALAIDCLGLAPDTVSLEFSGGSRGWKGDVPVVRINSDRIRSLGWSHTRSSRMALSDAMTALIPDARASRL